MAGHFLSSKFYILFFSSFHRTFYITFHYTYLYIIGQLTLRLTGTQRASNIYPVDVTTSVYSYLNFLSVKNHHTMLSRFVYRRLIVCTQKVLRSEESRVAKKSS